MSQKEPQSSGGREGREGGLGCRSAFLPAATGYQELSSQWKEKFKSVPRMFGHFCYPLVPTMVEAANVQEHRQLTLDVTG